MVDHQRDETAIQGTANPREDVGTPFTPCECELLLVIIDYHPYLKLQVLSTNYRTFLTLKFEPKLSVELSVLLSSTREIADYESQGQIQLCNDVMCLMSCCKFCIMPPGKFKTFKYI